MNTGQMLDELATMGKPHVGRQDNGWYASIEFPAPEGVSMVARSDYGHPSHESALIQLMARITAARAQFQNSTTTLIEGTAR